MGVWPRSTARPPGPVLPTATLSALLALLAWLSAAGIATYPGYGWDDSYIAYQYGKNLAQGFGLRFNPSDAQPGEGFSSLLHVFVVALGARFGLDPLLLTRVLSIACIVALPLVLGAPLARCTGAGWLACAAAAAAVQLFWFALQATRYHLHLGMETLLFQFGLALHLAWSLFELDPPRGTASRRPARFALGLGAAALVVLGRPEGFALVGITYLCVFTARTLLLKNLDAQARRVFLSQAAAVAAGIAVFFIAKLAYFGYLLPNPYYVKSGRGVWGYAGPLLPGLGQLKEFLADVAPALAAGGLLTWLTRPPARALLVLALSIAPGAAMALLYARALPEAAFHYRFLFPYLVHVQMFVAGAVCLALACWPRLQHWAPAALGCAAVATVLLVSPATRRALPQPAGWLDHRLENLPHPWWLGMRIGKDLAKSGLGQEATVAASMAGALPWYSGMQLVDLLGLATDRLSGREPLTPEGYWRYQEQARPDVLVSAAPPATPGSAPGDTDPALSAPAVVGLLHGAGSEITAHGDPRRLREMVQREMIFIRDHYAFGAAYRMESSDWTFVYIRRDSPLRHQLRQALGRSSDPSRLGDLARSYLNDPRALRLE